MRCFDGMGSTLHLHDIFPLKNLHSAQENPTKFLYLGDNGTEEGRRAKREALSERSRNHLFSDLALGG